MTSRLFFCFFRFFASIRGREKWRLSLRRIIQDGRNLVLRDINLRPGRLTLFNRADLGLAFLRYFKLNLQFVEIITPSG